MEMTPLQKLKVELLCYGVRLGEEKRNFTRYRFKRASLSEGLYFILRKEGEELPANLAVFEDFVEKSPYSYRGGLIFRDEVPVCEAEIVPDPKWYKELLPDGREFQTVLQQHGKDILALAISGCFYKEAGKGCLFCALQGDGGRKSPEDVEYIIRSLKEKGFRYRELNINSGTMAEKDYGAEVYGEIARRGKKEGLSVYIQIPPIEKDAMIFLKEAGVDSISINVEIYNEELRRKFCPGKAQIKREKYLSALSDAVEVFGASQVSSWLIIGLEPEEETMKGIDEMVKRGVIPYPSIFRPLKGSKLENLPPPSPEMAMRVYSYLNQKLFEKGINPELSKSGCVNCGCCSVIG